MCQASAVKSVFGLTRWVVPEARTAREVVISTFIVIRLKLLHIDLFKIAVKVLDATGQ